MREATERFFQAFQALARTLAAVNGQTWSDAGIPFEAHGGYRRPVQLRILGPLEVTEGNGPIRSAAPSSGRSSPTCSCARTTSSRPRS